MLIIHTHTHTLPAISFLSSLFPFPIFPPTSFHFFPFFLLFSCVVSFPVLLFCSFHKYAES